MREFLFPFLGILICPVDGGYGLRLNDERTSCFRIFLGPTLPELNCLRRFNWNVENARIMGSAIGMDE